MPKDTSQSKTKAARVVKKGAANSAERPAPAEENLLLELGTWEDKYVRRDWEDPSQLLAAEDNWQIHPQYQQLAMKDTLDDLGWLDDIKVDINSGRVFNGHMRVLLAMQENKRVPVSYYSLTSEEFDRALASFDAIQKLAVSDREKYKALAAKAQKDSDIPEKMKALLDHTAGKTNMRSMFLAQSAGGFLGQHLNTPPPAQNAENAQANAATLSASAPAPAQAGAASGETSVAQEGPQGPADEDTAQYSIAALTGAPRPNTPYTQPSGSIESTSVGGITSVDGAASTFGPELQKVLFMFPSDEKQELFDILNPVKQMLTTDPQNPATYANALLYVARRFQELSAAQS